MSRFWQIISAILGALSALFYALNKKKDKQIEKHKDEAERYKAEAEMQGYIAESERKAKRVKDRINSASESDIDSMLKQQGALRDESERG